MGIDELSELFRIRKKEIILLKSGNRFYEEEIEEYIKLTIYIASYEYSKTSLKLSSFIPIKMGRFNSDLKLLKFIFNIREKKYKILNIKPKVNYESFITANFKKIHYICFDFTVVIFITFISKSI